MIENMSIGIDIIDVSRFRNMPFGKNYHSIKKFFMKMKLIIV